MIDRAYLHFIKSKYTEGFKKEDLIKLKDLFAECFKSGIPVRNISAIKRASIEFGVLGRELTEYERKVDNYILSTPSIVRAFIQHGLEDRSETLEEVQESIKKIRESILNNMSFSQREAYLIGE